MRSERRLIPVLLFTLAVSVAGCGSDPPASPTPSSSIFEGAWVGTFADAAIGPVPVTFRLTAGPVTASGTWTAVIADQTVGGSLVAISARESGSVRHLLSGACAGGGFWTLDATISANRMTGQVGAFLCSGLTSGTVDLVRQ
jgi:hypothetical protein